MRYKSQAVENSRAGTASMLYGFYDIDRNGIAELILGREGVAGNEVL